MNVYILLDRSGSMSTLWNEAIGSINGYVSKLKKTDKVHLAVFDNVSHDVIRDVKVKDWTNVSAYEATPRGGTPLYDSCGKIMAVAEADNAKRTVLVVMTDGYENASQEHTQASIKAKVKEFEDKNWEVVFLGANFDAVETVSGSVGVVASKTINASAGNFARGMDALYTASAVYATHGTAINFTADDKLKVNSPL